MDLKQSTTNARAKHARRRRADRADKATERRAGLRRDQRLGRVLGPEEISFLRAGEPASAAKDRRRAEALRALVAAAASASPAE